MRDKILIGIIVFLLLIVIGIGVYVAITPTVIPEKPIIQFPANELASTLEIEKLDREIPRIFAVRNYPIKLPAKDINLIKSLRYYIVNPNSTDHMLIVPFETGGNIIVGKMLYDEYKEQYVCGETSENIILNEKITPNYALLLKYNRPTTEVPELYVRVIQGDKTATYVVNNLGVNQKKDTIEQIKMDTTQIESEPLTDPGVVVIDEVAE